MDVHGAMMAQVEIANQIAITSMAWSCEKFKMEETDESQGTCIQQMMEDLFEWQKISKTRWNCILAKEKQVFLCIQAFRLSQFITTLLRNSRPRKVWFDTWRVRCCFRWIFLVGSSRTIHGTQAILPSIQTMKPISSIFFNFSYKNSSFNSEVLTPTKCSIGVHSRDD